MNGKNLVEISQKQGFIKLLTEALKSSDSILTGALGTPKLQLLMVPGRLIQAARNNEFITQLATEFEKLKDTGKIKNGVENSEEFKSSFQELLSALEDPPVDKNKFNLLKTIFVESCKIDYKMGIFTPNILINIVKNLSTGEILVLSAVNKIRLNMTEREKEIGSAREWLIRISEETNFSGPSMVEVYETSLIEKKILSKRLHSDRSGVVKSNDFRLTDLGLTLCEFLSNC